METMFFWKACENFKRKGGSIRYRCGDNLQVQDRNLNNCIQFFGSELAGLTAAELPKKGTHKNFSPSWKTAQYTWTIENLLVIDTPQTVAIVITCFNELKNSSDK